MSIPVILYFFLSAVIIAISTSLNRDRRELIYFLICLGLVLMSAFRIEQYVPDYTQYVENYNKVLEGDRVLIEPTFYLISFIAANPVVMFLIYAIIGVSLKFYAIKKISNLVGLSLIFYISYLFMLHEMIQIRVGVAAGLLLLSIKYIYDRDLKRFLATSLIAILFHYSAVIIFPLWFLGRDNKMSMILFLSLPIAIAINFLNINLLYIVPIPALRSKLELYQSLAESGMGQFAHINVFNYIYLSKMFLFYLLLWKYDILIANNRYSVILMKCYGLSLFAYIVFAIIPVLAFRVSELLSVVEVVLYPMLYYIFKQRWIGAMVVFVVSVGYIFLNLFYNRLLG